jgi:hypothetical protein
MRVFTRVLVATTSLCWIYFMYSIALSIGQKPHKHQKIKQINESMNDIGSEKKDVENICVQHFFSIQQIKIYLSKFF